MFERVCGECLFGVVGEGAEAGALYFTQRQPLDALIAWEICHWVAQYQILDGENPVLLVQDDYGLYDEGLGNCAQQPPQPA
jgi:putative aminopeptidase FrvX